MTTAVYQIEGVPVGTVDMAADSLADRVIDAATETSKLDSAATDGLTGVSNSLAYRVAEIERHLHSGARWFEAATVPDAEVHVADRVGSGAGAFRIDAGNDAWGSWVQILGSTDTPADAGKVFFDPHQVIVEDVERAATYFVQMARGESGAAGLAAGTYSEFAYVAANTKSPEIILFQTGRAPAGSKVWARCICPAADTAWMDLYIGLHEYEG